LECQPNGPDQLVCEYLIKRLRPDADTVPITLENKFKLIERCGKATALLFDVDNCQRVVIVWDVRPYWSPQAPIAEGFCLHEEREGIFASLKEADVNSSDVHLVCIYRELESWLLADDRAIAKVISQLTGSRLTGRNKPKIKDEKKPESVKDPKARLMKIFKQHRTQEYNAYYHALRIVKELQNFDKIKRCNSFKRFALKATDTKL